MLPIVVPVSGPLPVFQPPNESEDEVLVPADASFAGGANYVILNLINGKRYEGETVNFKNRHYNHMRNMKNKNAKEYNYHLYKSMRKYGIENFRFYLRRTFKFEGREKLSDIEKKAFNKKFKTAYLHPCETYWIRRLGLLDPDKGYNRMETGKGFGGHIWTEEQKAKFIATQTGHTNSPTKPVTRCEILVDGETQQKVRLTRYESARAAEAANPPGASHQHIAECCLKHKGCNSAGGYLWWHCKEDETYDEDIMVKWVGNLPGTSHLKPVISKLELPNGDYLEQWHKSQLESKHALSTADKNFGIGHISSCCNGKRKRHWGYTFRRVTTEKRKDFDEDGKRIIKSKKRKRN